MWQKDKPKEPCVFLTRTKFNEEDDYTYNVWILDWIGNDEDGKYLAIMDGDGDEWDDWDNFESKDYFICFSL